MYKEKVAKLNGHVKHLFFLFLDVNDKYAFLEPMLFNNIIKNKFENTDKAYGFQIIRRSLIYSCIQSIANILSDPDKRSPSVKSIIDDLGDEQLRNLFKEKYACFAKSGDYYDLYTEKFENIYSDTKSRFENINQSNILNRFKDIRDKIIAHCELTKDNTNNYKLKLNDISILDLKWDSLKKTIQDVKYIVNNLNILIRNLDYSLDSHDEELQKSVNYYWEL